MYTHIYLLKVNNRKCCCDQKCCFSWTLGTKMLMWVCYRCCNFQDTGPCMGAIQCPREYKKLLKSISTHFNCLFMQLKQQTAGHNNIPFLGVHAWRTIRDSDWCTRSCQGWSLQSEGPGTRGISTSVLTYSPVQQPCIYYCTSNTYIKYNLCVHFIVLH